MQYSTTLYNIQCYHMIYNILKCTTRNTGAQKPGSAVLPDCAAQRSAVQRRAAQRNSAPRSAAQRRAAPRSAAQRSAAKRSAAQPSPAQPSPAQRSPAQPSAACAGALPERARARVRARALSLVMPTKLHTLADAEPCPTPTRAPDDQFRQNIILTTLY